MSLLDVFLADSQGAKFSGLTDEELFPRLVTFFADPSRQRRMIESERHHRRPPLAGVVVELEQTFFVHQLQRPRPRVRQGVGVLVRIVMAQHDWRPAGRRGSLKGLSRWFLRSERYVDVLETLAPEASDPRSLGRYAAKIVARIKALEFPPAAEQEWLERLARAKKKSSAALKQLAAELTMRTSDN